MAQSPKTTQPTKDEGVEADEALEAVRDQPEEIEKEEIERKIVRIPPVTEENPMKGLNQ